MSSVLAAWICRSGSSRRPQGRSAGSPGTNVSKASVLTPGRSARVLKAMDSGGRRPPAPRSSGRVWMTLSFMRTSSCAPCGRLAA